MCTNIVIKCLSHWSFVCLTLLQVSLRAHQPLLQVYQVLYWRVVDLLLHHLHNTSKQLYLGKQYYDNINQDVNDTMAGYRKEILPSSWSPIIKYSVYDINSEEKEVLGANIKTGKNIKRNEKLTTETHQYYVMVL